MLFLFFDKTIAGFLYGLIAGVYSTVAKVYDLLLNLVEDPNGLFQFNLPNIVDAIYVAAGVFMLFRVTISAIQMFLNPDLVSDNQVGAGKLLSRIMISIVLLLLLQPSSIILGKNGILARIENALLSEDGFITNIMDTKPTLSSKKTNAILNKNNLFYDNVYAANVQPKMTCYYYESENYNAEKKSATINRVYKISFYYADSCQSSFYKDANDANLLTVKNSSRNGTYVRYAYYSKEDGYKLNTLSGTLSGSYFNNTCGPTATSSVNNSNVNSNCPNAIALKDGVWSIDATHSHELSSGLHYAGNNFTALKNKLYTLQKQYKISSNNKFVKDNKESSAFAFSRTIAGTFMECIGDAEDCEENKDNMFTGGDSEDKIITNIADDDMRLDWFTGILVGLGVIVYLVILCIDVIIRRLKLSLLEMMAPIPIISYVDPKDKMLSSWFKMYISTYADLFLKLIGLAIMISLLSSDFLSDLFKDDASLFVKLLYIIAVLLFAKLVPSIISKIFGIEGMGGSFKDILGMGKAALGFGAGAALGGAVGLATGKGLGRLSGFANGALMGAGSGTKGNVLGGAQGISARNTKINQMKEDGLNFWDRTVAGIGGRVGYSPKANLDNQVKQAVDKKAMLDNFRKHKDNIEGMADSSNYLSDMKARMDLNPNSVAIKDEDGKILFAGKEAYKKYREAFIALNEVNRFNKDTDSVEYYDGTKWIDTGQKAKYYNSDGTISDINFEKGTVGKIDHAETIMRSAFNANHALQRELEMEGQSITNFASYEKAEGIARDISNKYDTQITAVKSSDKYARAEALENYSKSN